MSGDGISSSHTRPSYPLLCGLKWTGRRHDDEDEAEDGEEVFDLDQEVMIRANQT
jgi:hypothetical protein